MNGSDGASPFTEDAFRCLIRELKTRGYRFASYELRGQGRHVLWRHDVDFSMHRAARLAEIEAEEGVLSTYLVNPFCVFYNLLEPAVTKKLETIRKCGHVVGLHFDAEAESPTFWSLDQITSALARQRKLLEAILDAQVNVFSWHNPGLSNLLCFEDEKMAGMVNAYGASIRRDYEYCSDSNGYWRFKPMRELITGRSDRLHLLTHPEWWTPEPMTPSSRIDRAIEGRARASLEYHLNLLARSGRRQSLVP